MEIQSDGAGFLLGERRLKELATGVSHVHDNTAEILQLLKTMLQGESSQRESNYDRVTEIARSINSISRAKPVTVVINLSEGGGSVTTRTTGRNPTRTRIPTEPRETSSTGNTRTTDNSNRVGGRENRGRVSGGGARASSGAPTSGRDSRGRFVSSAQEVNDRSLTDSIKKGFDLSNLGSAPDVGGIDPTVDAVRELTTLFSPAKRAFGLMGRGAMWLYKKGKPKRSEVIPGEQRNHNDEVERSNYEERKILRKILDAINRQNGGGLLGSLAGLLGGSGIDLGRRGRPGRPGRNGGGTNRPPAPPVPSPNRDNPNRDNPNRDRQRPGTPGKFGKFLRKIPLLGALLGAGMVASDWSEQDNGGRGAGIGGLIGTGIGGVLGSFGGPVGTVAGGVAGGMLGEQVGQKIGDWTNTLKKQDIGSAIVNRWDDTLSGINKFIAMSWGKMGMGLGMSMMGRMGMGGGFMQASFRRGGGSGGSGASNYSDGGSSPSTYNPNNEVPISKVLETGKGYNVVELADGSVVKQTGNWNWRNRNPGNIERGDYTKGKGHISLDGAGGVGNSKRFAAFPTMAAGRQAKKDLIFEGKNYKNLDLMGAIARYAPKKENNTAAYQRAVLGAVGSNKRMSDYTAAERETIMNAIEQREGKVKSGKIEVIKPATKKYNATQPQVQPTPQQPTNSQGAKPVFVNAAQPAKATKPLYVSGSPKPAATPDYQFPKIIQKENSTPAQQAPMMASSNDNISQNVADRDITHAVTGGLGMRTSLA